MSSILRSPVFEQLLFIGDPLTPVGQDCVAGLSGVARGFAQ